MYVGHGGSVFHLRLCQGHLSIFLAVGFLHLLQVLLAPARSPQYLPEDGVFPSDIVTDIVRLRGASDELDSVGTLNRD